MEEPCALGLPTGKKTHLGYVEERKGDVDISEIGEIFGINLVEDTVLVRHGRFVLVDTMRAPSLSFSVTKRPSATFIFSGKRSNLLLEIDTVCYESKNIGVPMVWDNERLRFDFEKCSAVFLDAVEKFGSVSELLKNPKVTMLGF
ncbi:hypothetical protein Hanom_Chr15g01346121 [Helianthus anomalus]